MNSDCPIDPDESAEAYLMGKLTKMEPPLSKIITSAVPLALTDYNLLRNSLSQ